MEQFYYTKQIGEKRTLLLAPLTDRQEQLSGEQLDDVSGYFLFERQGTGELAEIRLIARLVSEEAVWRLRTILGLD